MVRQAASEFGFLVAPGLESPVVAGESILRITATKPERLSGFLRQPLPLEPKVGTEVEIRTRGNSRQVAASKILEVGAAMEAIPSTLVSAMHLPPSPAPEPGLRIQFALPAELKLRPGEFVDVVIH